MQALGLCCITCKCTCMKACPVLVELLTRWRCDDGVYVSAHTSRRDKNSGGGGVLGVKHNAHNANAVVLFRYRDLIKPLSGKRLCKVHLCFSRRDFAIRTGVLLTRKGWNSETFLLFWSRVCQPLAETGTTALAQAPLSLHQTITGTVVARARSWVQNRRGIY